jgi:hypothetical protein
MTSCLFYFCDRKKVRKTCHIVPSWVAADFLMRPETE